MLVARDGQRTTGRLNIEPAAGSIHLDIEEAAGHSLDFLHRELAERLMAGSMRMNLVLQVAGPSDAVDDISVPWSDERRKIMLGTLVLDRINVDQSEQERLMFDPARLGPGIEPAGDPMLAVRSASYRLSLQRRSNA